MSGRSPLASRAVPAPGQAPLPAPNAAALLRRNASDPAIRDRPAVRFEDRIWTHAEYVAESCRFGNLFLSHLPAGAPPHVAVLLDNIPEYLFAFGGAALTGSAVVGLNHTRRGEHLLRDVEQTHCGLVITEARHLELLEPILDRLPPVLVVGETLDGALAGITDADPGVEPD
ncbi:MAG: AMP-binding protein, partial [Acidimicrobiia bacterium]